MMPVVCSLAPGSVFFSTTVTRKPAVASACALARPAKLAPTTTQSDSMHAVWATDPKLSIEWRPRVRCWRSESHGKVTMHRRLLLRGAAGAAVALVAPRQIFAADYDLVIRGGRVIDPSQRLDRIADVAIRGGKIAAVGRNLSASE